MISGSEASHSFSVRQLYRRLLAIHRISHATAEHAHNRPDIMAAPNSSSRLLSVPRNAGRCGVCLGILISAGNSIAELVAESGISAVDGRISYSSCI